jgi:hypothetical protein
VYRTTITNKQASFEQRFIAEKVKGNLKYSKSNLISPQQTRIFEEESPTSIEAWLDNSIGTCNSSQNV